MTQKLLACPECDALQHEPAPVASLEPALRQRSTMLCWRCGAVIVRGVKIQMERSLALTIAAAILFCIANSFPLFALEFQGASHATSLFGAVQSLTREGMDLVAGLVFATTILFPAVEITVLIYVFSAFSRGRENEVRGMRPLLRVLAFVERWGMIEVFMLGSLVSVVKLARIASIHPGAALWSFGGVMLLLAAVGTNFSPRQLWDRLDLQQ